MDLRKTLTLCLAVLLVAGFSPQSMAIEGDPSGWRVAVSSPDSAGWAGIGDSVIVTVSRTVTIGDSALAVFVGLYTSTDTVTTAEMAAVENSAEATVRATADAGGYGAVFNANAKWLSATATTPYSSASGVQTYRFAFGVNAGNAESDSRTSLRAQAFINHAPAGGFFVWKQLTSTSTASQFDIDGETLNLTVGDNHRFGIDGQRPLNTKIVAASVTMSDTFPDGGSTLSAGIGDVITANIQVSGVGSKILQARLFVHDITLATPAEDTAFATFSFDLLDLIAGPASKTLTLGAISKPSGQAITATQNRNFPNGQRVYAVTHLVDRAGNLSGATAGQEPPVGFSDNTVVHVIDTTLPTLTLSNPDSAGDYVTGNIDTSFNLISANATVAASNSFTFNGNPVRFTVNEGTVVRTVSVGDSVMDLAASNAVTAATNYAITPGLFSNGSVSVKVTVNDSVGNSKATTVTGVNYDETEPTITIYPSNSALGQVAGPDTINATTAQSPVITYSEVLDSASVRYVELGGANPADNVIHSIAADKLTTVGEEIAVTVTDTLLDGKTYSIQLVAYDMAGNVNATATDTLLYDKGFANPAADSFVVAPQGPTAADSVLVGSTFGFKVTAIDSAKTRVAGADRKAVTYKNGGVLFTVALGEADAAHLGQVMISGTGVDTTGLYGTGTALLGTEGWTLGSRTVNIKSEKALDAFAVTVSDTAGGKDINGTADDLFVDATEFSTYAVWVTEDGVNTEAVSGEFGVTVVPTDEYGNASLKAKPALDTRVNALGEIFAEISANKAQVSVPQGPQPIIVGGSAFTASANAEGTGLVISVLTSSVVGDTSGVGDLQTTANGKSASIAYTREGVVATPAGAPAAPDSLIVQDYLGADASGDQGGFVLVSFPNSEDHATVTNYRLYREILVTTGLDSSGNLTTVDPEPAWVSWVTVDAIGSGGLTQAVVPTLDNISSRWGISAERGKSSSDNALSSAAKRVFTKQNVQQMVKLLGLDPNRVFSHDELSELFTPSKDYVKSILGDRENVQFASLDPDLTSLVANSTVPQTIRTDGIDILSSLKTLANGPARAIDNIAPTEIDGGLATKAGGKVTLTWNASADDHVVAYSSYRGFAIPIAGVDHYVINRGTVSSGQAAPIATVSGGTTSYTIETPLTAGRVFYRIDAADLDNVTAGPGFSITNSLRIRFTDAANEDVFIVTLEDAQTPFLQDFEDFLDFAGAFNRRTGENGFTAQADNNDDGIVNFDDFLRFAVAFNKTAVTQDGQPIPATKPILAPQTPGLNENVELSLNLRDDRILPGQTITLDVDMANAKALQGYGLTLNYDATKFEFIEAAPAEEDLLKSDGAETPLFLHQAEEGAVLLANAIVDGSPVNGEGSVLSLTFKVLGEFEDDARFDIANAIVFDGSNNANPVVVLGSLEVQTTPTEFALLQNYPNPFNPETTIKYNLAEGAGVNLRIYNIVGQVVKTLVSERQSAGRYQVRWDGTDNRGSAVSSGIYFYQVAAGKFRDVKRLMLLK